MNLGAEWPLLLAAFACKKPVAIELWVEDNGPGIAPEARACLTASTVHHMTPRASVWGLAIVHQIARAYGTSVELAANPLGTRGLLVTVRFAAV